MLDGNKNKIMNGLNKVTLIGNLGGNPEIKYAANGNAIANLSIATNESVSYTHLTLPTNREV